jgi:hypothetical protein
MIVVLTLIPIHCHVDDNNGIRRLAGRDGCKTSRNSGIPVDDENKVPIPSKKYILHSRTAFRERKNEKCLHSRFFPMEGPDYFPWW